MVRGLYTAWTGLRNEEKRMDVVTNNMANADTTGYKKVDVTSQSFDRQLAVKIDDPTIGPNIKQGIGGVNLGVKIGETYYDMSQGISDRQKTSTIWHYPAADFLPSAQQTRVERQRHATRAMAISL